jgi:hypothetical protein
MEAFLFGLCLLTADIIVFLLLSYRKGGFALGFGVFSLLLAAVTAYYLRQYRLGLGEDAAFFGFRAHPVPVILLGLLTLAALVGAVLGAVILVKGKRREAGK